MLRPENMSYLDIAIHKDKIPAFLNEVPKYQIHIAEFKEPKEKRHHHIRREHQLKEDLEMIQHKIHEIEESIIYYFQKLEIDPQKMDIPEEKDRVKIDVTSVTEAIDLLHEKTTNESRRLKAYYNTIEKYTKDLKENNVIAEALNWLLTYRANSIVFEWFHMLEFRIFFVNPKDFVEMEVAIEHEEIPMILEYKEINDEYTVFFVIYLEGKHQDITEFCHTATEIKDFHEYFTEDSIKLEDIEKNINFAKARITKATESIQKSKNEAIAFRGYLELLGNIKKYELLETQFRENFRNDIVRLEAFIPTKREDEILTALDSKFHTHIRIAVHEMGHGTGFLNKAKIQTRVLGSETEEYDALSNMPVDQNLTIPSLVETKKIFKPFKLLTNLYGTANYSEIDPTPLVALTYPILFGLMFGDVGHGLVLILFGILIVYMKRNKKDSQMYDAGFLLIWLGIFAIIVGFLYGEFFGKPILVNNEHLVLFANPMEEITLVLKVFILIGVIHLSLGWILSMVNYVNKHQKYLAFADSFCKLALLLGGTFLVFNYMFDFQAWISPPYPVLWPIIPAVALLLVKPFGRIFKISYLQKETFSELLAEQSFDVGETFLSILSNVASYSRLLAMAMAHMGLMLVIETIAEPIIQKGLTFWSFLVVSLILVLGNLFVIILETFLSAIQALRLTFYEFFGKFYLADGIPYEYTQIDSDYSQIIFLD